MQAGLFLFLALIFLVALTYSSVGHGGASGYLALLSLYSFPPETMSASALVLNLLVAGTAFWAFWKCHHFSWSLTWPFIVTSVPAGAITGPITVTSPLGSATSSVAFRVPGALAVSPATLTIFARRTQQFTVAEVGNSPASVLWSVNDVAGGNPTVGTISGEGLYTAPSFVPLPPTVTVTATNSEDTRLSASATVTVVTPPDILLAARAVGVQIGSLLASDKNVAGSVSVQVGTSAGAVASGGLAISMGPIVTSVSPSIGARATTGLVLRIVGAELADASALAFRLNNALDNTISVTSLVIDPDGKGATATISIAAAAPVGARVLQVLTPSNASTAIGTIGNRFAVQ